jgi:hypothetical protein
MRLLFMRLLVQLCLLSSYRASHFVVGSHEDVVAGGRLQNHSFTVDFRVSSKVHKVLRRGSGVMARLPQQYLVNRIISG